MMDVKVERSPTADRPAVTTEEQPKFDVILKEPGRQTVDVIKVVSALIGLGLEEAMDLVESAPNLVKQAVGEGEAKDIKQRLEELGATIEIAAQGVISPAVPESEPMVPPAPQVPTTAASPEVGAMAEAQGWSLRGAVARKPRSRRSWVLLAATGGVAVVAAAIVVAVLYGGGREGTGEGDAPGTAGTASSTGAAGAETTAQGIQEKWKFKTGSTITSSLAIGNGAVYFSSKDGYLYAVDTETGQERWKFSPASEDYYPPVITDGVVCFGVRDIGSDDVYFCAVDAATGEEKWEFRPATGFSPLAIWDGAFYFGCDDGNVYALDAETGGEEWRFETGNAVSFGPAIADGVVCFGSSDACLYAVDAETGKEVWKFQTDDGGSLYPTIWRGVVYYPSGDGSGYLYAVDKETGQEKWKFRPASALSYPPAITHGVVCFGSSDGYLYALDFGSGQERWTTDTGGWSSRPVVAEGVVYAGKDDGYLYALEAESGRENWKFRPASAVSSFPAIADGVVYFGTNDGYLYAVPIQESERSAIKVGTVLSLTGARHSSGEAFHESYTRLVQDVQQIGGIITPASDERLPMELVVLDDRSDAAQHLAELEKLMDVDQLDLVVLPMSTAPLDDVAALAQEHGYLVMTGEPMALGLQTSNPYLLEFLHSMFSVSP